MATVTEREQLEAALALVERECRKANEDFHQAQNERTRAKSDWTKVLTDRLKADLDRRQPGSVGDPRIAGRRKNDADLAALFKEVDERQKAYLALREAEADWVRAEAAMSRAELDWVEAEARLNHATARRDQLIAALDELDQFKPGGVSENKINIKNSNKYDIHNVNSRSRAGRYIDGLRGGLARIAGLARPYTRPARAGRFDVILSARSLNASHLLGTKPVLRQSIGLLALTLSFLQYHYYDIQLQILSLPSVLPLPLE